MADNTKIEWADATANFWIGCTKLSPACDHCYAERDWDHRKHRVTWGPHGARDPVKAGPLVCAKLERSAPGFIFEHGRKPRVFINSLSDFADNHKSIRPEWREAVWQAARDCPNVIFMILTKRPQNLRDYLPADWGQGYPNVWLGTTAENQTEADRRIPHLLATPAAKRFLSIEPLLGPVDLTMIQFPNDRGGMECWDALDLHSIEGEPMPEGNCEAVIDWVIAGGESGPGARPMHPDWARSLRDQCHAAGVPFFFKQWGLHFPTGQTMANGKVWTGTKDDAPTTFAAAKSIAGRLLDGREWSEFPDAK